MRGAIFISIEWRSDKAVIRVLKANANGRVEEIGIDCEDWVCWIGWKFAPFMLH